MRATINYWPIASALLVAVAYLTIPASAVIGVLAAFWGLASWRLRYSWRDLADSVRTVHLTIGALLGLTFVLLASADVTGAPGIVVAQGTLVLVGPLVAFLGYGLVRVARHAHGRFRSEDLLDSMAYLLIPLALVATAAWPVLSSPSVSVDDRLTVACITALSAVIFLGGVINIIARSPDQDATTLLAFSATSLGLLGWLSVLIWIIDLDVHFLFPRLLAIPALAYLLAVERGELERAPITPDRAVPVRLSVVGDRTHRWAVYAGSGLAMLFLAVVASTAVPVVFAAAGSGLAVVKLAVRSYRLVRGDSVVALFDNVMSELAESATAEDALEHASRLAQALLGSDAVVEYAGSPGSRPDGPGTGEVQRANAVLSRNGLIQIRTSRIVASDRIRAVRYLANLTELVLGPRRPSFELSNEPPNDLVQAPQAGGFARNERSRLAVEGEQPAAGHSIDIDRFDPHSGLPNLGDFELQDHLDGVVVTVFYLHDLERVRDSIGADAGNSFVRRLVARSRRWYRKHDDQIWRGDGAKLIVMTPIESGSARSAGLDSATLAEEGRLQAKSTVGHCSWIEARRVSLSSPTALGMSFIAPAISAGFTVVDQPMPATEALQQAEMALMFARDNQPRTTVEYSGELHARMAREWQIESYLAAGLDDLAAAGFSVHYQPIIEASSGLVKIVEGLSRWDHPELGQVSPGEFIPIAERVGVVGAIDDYVLAQAIDDVGNFRAVDPEIVVQVNMSPSGIEAARLSQTAKTILHHLGGEDPGISIEITESALSNQPLAELVEVFSFLRAGNIGISLDDFGTGESNFERLSRLPFTQVKLADDFVRSNDSVLVGNVVHLVHGLDMTCVVEGVETMAQYEVAIAGGGDLIQGWVFAPAMPRDDTLNYAVVRRESVGLSNNPTSSAAGGAKASASPTTNDEHGSRPGEVALLAPHNSSARSDDDEPYHGRNGDRH